MLRPSRPSAHMELYLVPHRHRQIRLHGTLNLLLLALSNVVSNGFSRAFHALGSHLQIRQDLHPLAPVIEGVPWPTTACIQRNTALAGVASSVV